MSCRNASPSGAICAGGAPRPALDNLGCRRIVKMTDFVTLAPQNYGIDRLDHFLRQCLAVLHHAYHWNTFTHSTMPSKHRVSLNLTPEEYRQVAALARKASVSKAGLAGTPSSSSRTLPWPRFAAST